MRVDGLDTDEHLVRWMAVSFAGSAETSVRGAFPLGMGRIGTPLTAGASEPRAAMHTVPRAPHGRRGAIAQWASAADHCGFPVAGGDMVLGLSDQRRVHVWRPRFWRARPGRHVGWFPCSRIVQVATTRQMLTTRMTWLIDDSSVIGFESMHARRLRAFADAVLEAAAPR
jgi:hypothetical protein